VCGLGARHERRNDAVFELVRADQLRGWSGMGLLLVNIWGAKMKRPHIENTRFWALPDSSLKFIIKDCKDALVAMRSLQDNHPKISQYSDEICDACTVLFYRKNK